MLEEDSVLLSPHPIIPLFQYSNIPVKLWTRAVEPRALSFRAVRSCWSENESNDANGNCLVLLSCRRTRRG